MKNCPHCGVFEAMLHKPDCWALIRHRRAKEQAAREPAYFWLGAEAERG